MIFADGSRLYALCTYGVDPAQSAYLMQKYEDEDLVPLSELDSTEFHRAEGV